MNSVTYRPIGKIRSPFDDPEDVPRNPNARVDAEGTAIIDERFTEGLTALEGFSHVVLLTHLHRTEGITLRIDPPFADEIRPGIFATSGPQRPNSIGLSIVSLLEIDEQTVTVDGIDLIDGTPLLDIKPFAPKPDEISDLQGGWIEENLQQDFDAL